MVRVHWTAVIPLVLVAAAMLLVFCECVGFLHG
jgi:hypothetical protein